MFTKRVYKSERAKHVLHLDMMKYESIILHEFSAFAV